MSKWIVILLIGALVIGFAGALGGAYVTADYFDGQSVNIDEVIYTKLADVRQQVDELMKKPAAAVEEVKTSSVAARLTPTVVGISTITVAKDTIFGGKSYEEGVGSGVIVNKDGFILTNSHVVGTNPQRIIVYLKDGRETPGRILWQDKVLDLAVLKIQIDKLQVAELGNSDEITVGEEAIAIGNPLGLRYERTVTKGIVSGLNRSIMISKDEIMEDLIQTDAAINPGNSGGPLINDRGEVIGINTVKAGAEGLGFAIPINITKPIINKLIQNGSFNPTYLGVTMFDKEIAGYYSEVHVEEGILISDIIKTGPAYKGGIRANDIILVVDGKEVNTIMQLKGILYEKEQGDIIQVTYRRGGKEATTSIVLEEYR